MKKTWNAPIIESLEISETNCGGGGIIDGICTKDTAYIIPNDPKPPVGKS